MNNFHCFLLGFIFACPLLTNGQETLGHIIPNTNKALPESYNFQEYVFAEPADEGDCNGATNTSAIIQEVFFAQTHRHSADHPFHFIIGHRPLLLQVVISGNGDAPDVQVEGFIDGNSIGIKCLKGPSKIPQDIDLSIPDFENYFAVTLPKSWIKIGLELEVSTSSTSRYFNQEELKIGPYTEMNLVRVDQDYLDFNNTPHNTPQIENFLAETASAIPVSVVRYGAFPETVVFPEIVVTNETEQLVRLKSKDEKEANGVANDGYINAIAATALENMHKTTSDYLSTIYFGNTLNLAPGGWGGGGSFVSFDFDNVYIHELGHALSLPHWGNAMDEPTDIFQYQYPYGGIDGNGGGRGESWNFTQSTYDFIDPICRDTSTNNIIGVETSDAMQRNNFCLEVRSDGTGPWDGFGDFSAYAMHHYYIGTYGFNGTVNYQGEDQAFQMRDHDGFPIMSLENGQREYTRLPGQKQEPNYQEITQLPGDETLNTDVYLVYGTAHGSQQQGNIIYKPIKYEGHLPPIIDPTDPLTFAQLKTDPVYRDILGSPRDITLKMTYADGSILHAIVPTHSYIRPEEYGTYYGHFRFDVSNFSLVVPGEKELIRVELYRRPLVIANAGNSRPGNLFDDNQNITAENFMDEAVYITEYGPDRIAPIGTNTIGNRVWYDENRNGLDDNGEPGIANVKVVLWSDDDKDGIPETYSGFKTTDEEGYYQFTVTPGAYTLFVWQIDNWDEGGPLYGMTPSAIFTDADNDIDLDNNGRGFPFGDIFSGTINITADGEPLNDGDPLDDWYNLDPAGNQTVDFGFYCIADCLDFDQDGFTVEEDCDDNNASVNPANVEIVYNGLDDDCNPETLDDDLDRDGYAFANDCDDNNASIHPGTIEIPYNGVDDDCNPMSPDDDLDQDGFLVADDCDDFNSGINPTATEIPNNEIDEDCNGSDLMTATHQLSNSTVRFYPNPCSDILNTDVSGELNFKASIFDMNGKLIQSSLNNNQINISTIVQGTYLLTIEDLNSKKRLIEKIVIMR